MTRARLMASSLALVLLAACTEPTAYAPAVDRDGYSDSAIEANRYRVTFAGNSRTSRETVESYLLYRAAEVTLASGADWFRVTDRDVEVQTRIRNRGVGGFFPSTVFGRGRGVLGGSIVVDGRTSTRYEAIANIVVFPGQKPEADSNAYDARSVIKTVGPRVLRPNTDQR